MTTLTAPELRAQATTIVVWVRGVVAEVDRLRAQRPHEPELGVANLAVAVDELARAVALLATDPAP